MENIKDPFAGRKLADFKDEKREQFLKSVYDYCEEVGYDIKSTTTQTRQWARLYIRKYLGLSDEEIEIKFAEIKAKVDKSVSETRHNSGRRISNFNPVLLKYGLKQKNLWENEKQKEEVLKYIYDFCKNVKYDPDSIEELAKSFGFGDWQVYIYTKMYAIDYLGMTIEEFNELKYKLRRERNQPSIYKTFEDLLACEEENDRINILKSSEYEIGVLYKRAFDWALSSRRQDDLDKVRDIIRNARQVIKEEKRIVREGEKEKENLAQLPMARKMVLAFIESSEKISVFCRKNAIEQADFKKMVSLIQNYDQPLFEQYSDSIKKQQSKRFNSLLQSGKNILQQLSKGVALSDGTTREFDVIDYLLTTKLAYNEMLNVLKAGNIPEKDIRLFRIFINRNKIGAGWTKKEIENTLNTRNMFGVQFDSHNNIIPDSGYEVTREEKTNIMNYIKTQNIPLCGATYHCAFKRYQAGYLTFDEKGKVKQLKF